MNVFMSALNADTFLYYFPILLIVLTFELSLSVYKSSGLQWTTKLAMGNLVINLLWIALIISIVINPNLFNPEFVPYLAKIYASSTDRITEVINLVMNIIIASVIVTNAIDVYNGFSNVKVNKKSGQT
jgi:hypothetical protein